MSLANCLNRTGDASLRIQALANFPEGAFAEDATYFVLRRDIIGQLKALKEAELEDFPATLSHLGRA